MNRENILAKIKFNITKFGRHITFVSGGQEPRYAYTIGLFENHDLELIFAGGIFYLEKDVRDIINSIAAKIHERGDLTSSFSLDAHGGFTLKKVHPSWSNAMMLGVYDYYNIKQFSAYQIVPESRNYTLDIPNMAQEWSSQEQPIWKWLKEDWTFNISKNGEVVTNLDALKGNPITEIMRWEEEMWEMFSGAGPEINQEDMRVVPIGVLLGIDKSLLPALELKVGKGMWREGASDIWNDWG